MISFTWNCASLYMQQPQMLGPYMLQSGSFIALYTVKLGPIKLKLSSTLPMRFALSTVIFWGNAKSERIKRRDGNVRHASCFKIRYIEDLSCYFVRILREFQFKCIPSLSVFIYYIFFFYRVSESLRKLQLNRLMSLLEIKELLLN